MIETILAYLIAHQAVLIGSATTIAQLLVIIVNTTRKLRKAEQGISEGNVIKPMKAPEKTSFLWIINPINLFKKP